MKIAFVTPYFYPAWAYGGPPRVAYELARALVERGHSLRVLTTDTAGPRRVSSAEARDGFARLDGVQTHYYRNISNYLAYRHRLFLPVKLMTEMRARLAGSDLVHAHEYRSMLTVMAHRAAKDLGIPFVMSPHGGLRRLGKRGAKAVFDAVWGTRVLRDTAAVLAVSPLEEAEARDRGVAGARVRLVPNGVRLDDFRDLPAPGGFRKRFGIRDPRLVLFLARLNRIKGADLLIRAFARVIREVRDTALVIAGPDEGEGASLARLADDLGCRAVMPGVLDACGKMEALVDAAVLVIPSRDEIFSVTALEALMCGTPVITSSTCGLPPVLDESCGVARFRSEEIDDLAQQMLAALTDRGNLKSRAKIGRAIVAGQFSMAAIAEQAERVYAELLAECRSAVVAPVPNETFPR